MNPETTPLAHGCMIALGLDATNEKQLALQEQCAGIIESLVGLEMLLEEDAEDYPEAER